MSSIGCPDCGSSFSLLSDETTPYDPINVRSIGHFQLVKPLGSGGYGTVWMARDEELDRTVAIKIPHKGQLSQDEAAKFLREARSAAQLNHPNIVSVHEVGREADVLYIVSDYVEGLSLADWLSGQRLTTSEAAGLAIKIVGALHHAHEAGVIHRDLKPGNIMLDADGEPHIMDFGLARREAGEMTMTADGQVMGTPAYMSPEQAKGESHNADRRSDVYSFGVVLFQLLTGERPFRGNDRMLLYQVINEEAPSPRQLNSSVHRDLETICLKCLEKEPDKRFATAYEVEQELERFLNGEPIRARPISAIARSWRWARRNRLAAMSIATVSIVLLAAASVFGVSSIFLRRLADRETAARRIAEDRLVQFHAANGVRYLEENDLIASLPWLAKAMGLHEEHKEARGEPPESVHRVRLSAALRNCVGLSQMWWRGDGVRCAEFDPTGDKVVIAGGDNMAQVMDVATGNALAPPLKHAGEVRIATFSPTGERIATASADGTARIWETASGRPVTPGLRHDNMVVCVAFNATGTRVITGSEDSTAKVWDASSGELEVVLKHGARVTAASFSPDNSLLLTASRDGTARLWDSAGTERATLRHEADVNSASFSPDGRRILTASADRTARVWDRSGRPISAPLTHHDQVRMAAFSPGGERVLTASRDHTARVWMASTGAPVSPVMQHHSRVKHASFSPDGRHVVTGSESGIVRIWNARDGKLITPPINQRDQLYFVWFHPDGHKVLACSISRRVYIWDLAGAELVPAPLRHRHWVNFAEFSDDGKRLVTASWDRTAQVWDAETFQPAAPAFQHQFRVHTARFDRDGNRVVTTCGDGGGTVTIWDADTGQSLQAREFEGPVTNAEFNGAGDRVLVVSGDQAVVWDPLNDQIVAVRHQDTVRYATFNADGSQFVTCSDDGTARIWGSASGKAASPPMQHPDRVDCAQFSRDGSRLLTTSSKNRGSSSYIWDADTGKILVTRHHEGSWYVLHTELSPDETTAVTAAAGGAEIWDTHTGESATAKLNHSGMIEHAAFSRSGRMVATAGWDHTARVWDAATGSPLTPPLKHNDWVTHVAFSSRGDFLVSTGRDQMARIWDLRPLPGKPNDLLTLAECWSGQRVDGIGETRVLTMAELQRLWSQLKESKPEWLGASEPQVYSWHRREADDASQSGDWTAALFHLDRVLRIKADDSRSLNLRANALAELEQFARSAADYRAAATGGSGTIDSMANLALVSLASGDKPGYRDACTKLWKLSGAADNHAAGQIIARVCLLAPESGVEPKALLEFSKAAPPQEWATRVNIAASYLRLKQWDQAISSLTSVEPVSDDHQVRSHEAIGWLILAQALERKGDRESAAVYWRQAKQWFKDQVKLAPESPSLPWRERVQFQVLAALFEDPLQSELNGARQRLPGSSSPPKHCVRFWIWGVWAPMSTPTRVWWMLGKPNIKA